ncbi:MAG: GGDEF domain-containing protein [Chitinispirillia bacterium]|nr:GGDEF domain-containing protein [Chitinispirillia bacterium]MCL2269630.1 GGDEF domain-containing protein [Chitinispirillia bacterium]
MANILDGFEAPRVRPTLGFFVSELENSYAQTLVRGITDAAAAADANVIIFPGKSPKVPYDYRYQYNAIYKLATKNSIDALILATGTMVNFLSEEEFKEFYGRYSDIPLVSISIQLEGVSSVLIDNKVGLRSVLEHLVSEHKFERIAFIGGPESNTEAQERFAVYKDVLKEHGLEFDPDLVVTGDFTKYSGVRAITEFFDDKGVTFQALAAANDEMALSAMGELQRRGYRVPEDIAVVGFDNVESTHYSTPTLTTVAQPIYEQAYKSVELACRLIEGRAPHNISLPTSMVLRESCGCFSHAVASVSSSGGSAPAAANEAEPPPVDADTARIEAILSNAAASASTGGLDEAESLGLLKEMAAAAAIVVNDREEKYRYWQDTITIFRGGINLRALDREAASRLEDFFHKARVLLLEIYFKSDSKRWGVHHNDIVGLREVLNQLVSAANNTRGALRSIVPNLREMGMSCFYVFLHDKFEVHEITTDWEFHRKITLAVADDDLPGSSELSGMSVPVMSILDRNLYSKERRYTFVVSSLFYMNEHFGFVVCEPSFNDIYLFESLVVEINCSLKLINLIEEQHGIKRELQNALEKLEAHNEKLSSISETDELTKLLNRRGFLNHARYMLGMSRRTNKDGILFFADLDGLKGINDNFGHEEGDNAIIAVASALRKTFREADVLARLGGDEFTVFTLNTNPGMLDMFKLRIDAFIDEHNQRAGKGYRVEVSIGAVPFKHSDVVDVETLMNKADVLMYQLKKEKKAARQAK